MTDRELLEKAAKAAGITGWQSKHGYWNMKDIDGKDVVCCSSWPKFDPNTGEALNPTFASALLELGWSPLTDDGDALRLAVKLKISVTQFSFFARAEVDGNDDFVEAQSDPYAATRRAIVRAAAAIGETL